MNKKISVRGKKVNLSIWDTAGQERFHALGPIYYRDSHGKTLSGEEAAVFKVLRTFCVLKPCF